jgi:hypothetical protein
MEGPLPRLRVLAHALLVDTREDGSFDPLITAQIALDCLTKEL